MSAEAFVVIRFVACALVILFAGTRLSRYGHVIGELTGLGGTWMGLVALASVTSLPELVTGASSVVLFDLPDIAAGDAIGSCMFNLVIFAMLDVRDPVPLSARMHQGHVLTAAFGIVLLGLAALGMLAGPRAPMIGSTAVHSLVFLACYGLAMRTMFVFERARLMQLAGQMTAETTPGAVTLARAGALYAAHAVLLVAAATYLPGVSEELSRATGLDRSVVGTLFVAASTSLPEIAVSMAAMRLGAIDMAAANLFGSNIFNIAVLGIDDLLYTRGSLLAAVAPSHLVTLTAAMMMTAVAITGLTFRASRKRYRLSWDSAAIVAIYAVAIASLAVLS